MNTAENDIVLTPQEIAFKGLRESGATIDTASKKIGKSLATGKRMEKKRKLLTLTDGISVNSAIRTIKKFSKGQAVNGIEPNANTVLMSAKEFTDRAFPKVSLSISANIADPVDLSRFTGTKENQ